MRKYIKQNKLLSQAVLCQTRYTLELSGQVGINPKTKAIAFVNVILDYLNAHGKLAYFFMPGENFNEDEFKTIIKICWYGKYNKVYCL